MPRACWAAALFSLRTQLQLRILERAEQPLEQVAPLGGFGVENLQKIALRDHHGLRELVAGQPDQILHALRDFIQSRPALAGVGLKLRRVLAHDHAVAALAGAGVFGIAAQTVVVPSVAERQLHPRILRLGGVVRAEGLRGAAILAARGFAVQREADGVENRGLARAGVAGDQEQAVLTQLFKIDLRRAGVRAKGAHRQLQRLHRTSPSNSFRIAVSISMWRSLGATSLFCSR